MFSFVQAAFLPAALEMVVSGRFTNSFSSKQHISTANGFSVQAKLRLPSDHPWGQHGAWYWLLRTTCHNAFGDEVYYGCRHCVWKQPFQSTQPGMFQRSVGNIKPGVGEMFLLLCRSGLAGADSLLISSQDEGWVKTVSFINPSTNTKSPAAQKWTRNGGFPLAFSASAQAKLFLCSLGKIHLFVFKWAAGPRDALIMDTRMICV